MSQLSIFRLLVVEDNHSDYQLLERSLKRSDLNCILTWVATAKEALTLLSTEKFDVVLLDYALPDLNGLDLFSQMIASGFDLPVIFVTGMGNEQAAVLAFELGAQDYLVKDIGGEYLNLLPFVVKKGFKQWEDSRERVRTEKALRDLNADLEKKIEVRTKEIKESELLTRAILSSLESHIAVLDKDGRIIAVNTAWERFACDNGDPKGILTSVGCNYLNNTREAAEQGDEYALQILDGLQRVLSGQENYFLLEYPSNAPEENRWFNLSITSLKSESGGAVTAHTDITSLKRILDQEKEQRLWAETLQEITRFLNRSLNLEGVLQGILGQLARVVDYHSASVMLLNDGKLDIVAYQHKEGKIQAAKGIEFRDLAHVNHGLENQAPVYVPNTKQDPRWKDLSGTEYIHSWVGIPLVAKNKAFGMLNLNHMMPDAYTEKQISMAVAFANQAAVAIENARLYQQATREIEVRKRAEAALEEERASLAQKVSERTAELTSTNVKLSQAMRAKDQFLANMSHELRTPLTAILGKTEVMQEGIYGSLTERQLHAVKTVHSSGTHLLSLINDILDVVRIESGQLELYWEPVALNAVCDAGIQLINEEARGKGIKVNKRFDDQIHTIQGDNKRLTQIIMNLLSNAVKFTPMGGEIGLEVFNDQADDTVKIVVWDTGIGISEAGKQQLFGEMNQPKPFAQLENSLARQYQGTGLGLTLIYSLTRMHNGHISIESKVGEGTQITVSLPSTNENRPPKKTAESTE